METLVKQDPSVKNDPSPRFISKDLLNPEQLNDPDYRLKLLENLYASKYPISCSKCHHCR